MLVHVTRFTAVQEKVATLVRDEVKAIEQRLKRGDGNAPNKLVDELRALWERDFEPTTAASDCALAAEKSPLQPRFIMLSF
jgi:hypothetical protein